MLRMATAIKRDESDATDCQASGTSLTNRLQRGVFLKQSEGRFFLGMRDGITHDYDEVDLEEVWTVMSETLPQLLS
jgi:uncharacterized protein YutE (UPF0331/DUF86 family)